jgi:SAM-dependent methyltransferase
MSAPETNGPKGENPQPGSKTDEVNEIIFGDTDLDTRMRDQLYREFGVLTQPEFQGENVDFYEMALAALDLRPSDKVIDLCCGSGEFTRMIAESGHPGGIMGVDISLGAINLAKSVQSKGGFDGISYEVGDARDLSFIPSGSKNKLTINYGLYHMAEPQRALKEAHRILEPGGTIVVLTRGRFNLVRQWSLIKGLVEKMGYVPSDSPYLEFDIVDADEAIAEFFVPQPYSAFEKLVEPGKNSVQRVLKIDASGWKFYSHTLASNALAIIMAQDERQSDGEIGAEVRAMVEKVVKPLFFGEINGPSKYFMDYAQDRLIRAVKGEPPDSTSQLSHVSPPELFTR